MCTVANSATARNVPCVTPRTVRAWRSTAELRGRVVMRDGEWL